MRKLRLKAGANFPRVAGKQLTSVGFEPRQSDSTIFILSQLACLL